MSILCDDLAERVLVELGSIYAIECTTIAGGYCQASAAEHLRELRVCPGLTYEQYKPLIRKQIREEAKPYAKNWLHDARRITIMFKSNIFDSKRRFVHLIFDDTKVATYTIRDKYNFELNEHPF